MTEIEESPPHPSFAFADDAWVKLSEDARNLALLLQTHGENIAGMMAEIGELEFPEGEASMRFSAYSRTFSIDCHGPVQVLNTVCRIVRQRGYDWHREAGEEGMKEFVCLPLYEEGKVRTGQVIGGINFSSTTCRRVKVGTKFVEVDDYEIQCK